MTLEVIEGEAVEVAPVERALVPAQPGQALVAAAGETGPADMIAKASSLASALRDIVERQKLYAVISGKKYPQVEAWATIGRMDNVVAMEDGNPVRHDDGSYEATVQLIRLSDGMVVGRASAICGMPDDKPWSTRAEYARRSMAVTRATSRAFRQEYSWIMALAGYEPTPADEMPHEARDVTPRDDRPASGPVVNDGGLQGTVIAGSPPVDLQLRQTPDGAIWGCKVKSGTKGYQAVASGPLAEALSMAGIKVGDGVTVWGVVEKVPWQKDGKDMPPYSRVIIDRIQTDEWTLPAPAGATETPVEAESVPMLLDDDERALIAGGLR